MNGIRNTVAGYSKRNWVTSWGSGVHGILVGKIKMFGVAGFVLITVLCVVVCAHRFPLPSFAVP
jgi:hypothetical protein